MPEDIRVYGNGEVDCDYRGEPGILGPGDRIGTAPREDVVLMEYVGFEGKDGKELCQGDIIEFINHDLDEDTVVRGYIDFMDGTFIVRRASGDLYRFWNDGDHDWYSIEQMRYWPEEDKPVILGTKCENPKLLRKIA